MVSLINCCDQIKLVPKIYSYEVTIPAASRPIELSEFKMQTRIDEDSTLHNEWIEEFILDGTVSMAEEFTGRVFISRTFSTTRNCFDPFFQLDRANFIALTSFKYTNIENTEVDVPLEDYYVVKNRNYGFIYPAPEKSFPNDLTEKLDSIKIEFTAGYGETKYDVPIGLRQAMLQHATFLYQNRGDCASKDMAAIPASVMTIYNQYVISDISGVQYHG